MDLTEGGVWGGGGLFHTATRHSKVAQYLSRIDSVFNLFQDPRVTICWEFFVCVKEKRSVSKPGLSLPAAAWSTGFWTSDLEAGPVITLVQMQSKEKENWRQSRETTADLLQRKRQPLSLSLSSSAVPGMKRHVCLLDRRANPFRQRRKTAFASSAQERP